jgi:hypothetical protein
LTTGDHNQTEKQERSDKKTSPTGDDKPEEQHYKSLACLRTALMGPRGEDAFLNTKGD